MSSPQSKGLRKANIRPGPDGAVTRRSGGSASPLGAAVSDGGVNFSVFSRDATSIDLLLFDHVDFARPSRIVTLDRKRHRTCRYWHVFVPRSGRARSMATVLMDRSTLNESGRPMLNPLIPSARYRVQPRPWST